MSFLYSEAYYLMQNPDVKAAVAAGVIKSGFEHWQAYGAQEGRSASPFFDWERYRDLNPDLVSAGIDTKESLIRHFNTYGFQENRPFISPALFDPVFYAASNPDLQAAGLTSSVALMQHFQKVGVYEGRLAHPNIGGAAYIEQYPDLNAYWNATGSLGGFTNKEAAGVWHFYNFGLPEGRSAASPAISAAGQTGAADVDGNHLFSAGDFVSVSFKKPVDTSTLSLTDLALSGGHNFGEGATLTAVNPLNGFANEFRVVLGRTPTLVAGDEIAIPKAGIVYEGGVASSVVEKFLVPRVETIAPQAKTTGSINVRDTNANGSYGAGDQLTIKFSEPISKDLVLADLAVSNGQGFGAGASLVPLLSSPGFASEFTVTLGRGATLNAADEIRILPARVHDMAGNPAANAVSFVLPVLRDTSPPSDTTAPMLSTSSPLDGVIGVAAATNIVLTFSEPVVAGSGNIVISDGSDTRTISVLDTNQVTISGNTVTINPTFDLLSSGAYSVQIPSGVLRDAAGNPYAGIADTTTLNFFVADNLGPTITALSLASTTSLLVTSNESGHAGLYVGATLIGTDVPLSADVPAQLTPQAQSSVINASLIVSDMSSNTTTSSSAIYLGTTLDDAFFPAAGAGGYVFGYDGNDYITGDNTLGLFVVGGPGADGVRVYSATDLTLVYAVDVANQTSDSADDGGVTINYDSIEGLNSTNTIRLVATNVNVFGVATHVFGGGTGENWYLADFNGNGRNARTDVGDIYLMSGWGMEDAGARALTQVNLSGTSGADILTGGSKADTLYGGNGGDVLKGVGGDDIIYGGNGNDSILGNIGEDLIYGEDGDDLLEGGQNNDTIFGGAGSDSIWGGTTGVDHFTGGADADTFRFEVGNSTSLVKDAILDFGDGLDIIKIFGESEGIDLNSGISGVSNLAVGGTADLEIAQVGAANMVIAITNGGAGPLTIDKSMVQLDIILANGAGRTAVGGDLSDGIRGGDGSDNISAGAGGDVIVIGATSEDNIGEQYDGGAGANDALLVTGVTSVDLTDDVIANIEILDLATSSAAQNVTLFASQLAGFTHSVLADSSDSLTVKSMTGGSMSASGGTDTFIWSDADHGLSRIASFDRAADDLRFDFVLNQGSNGAAITTVDGVNDLSSNNLLYAGFGVSSFAQAGKAVYVMYLSIGGFDAATASGGAGNATNGIDFGSATEANILANVEAALENASEGGGPGIISRVNGSAVTHGAVGTDIVFLLDDGSNTAVIRYQEGGTAEADYAGELSLLGVITGNTGGDFNPAWNANNFALFA